MDLCILKIYRIPHHPQNMIPIWCVLFIIIDKILKKEEFDMCAVVRDVINTYYVMSA